MSGLKVIAAKIDSDYWELIDKTGIKKSDIVRAGIDILLSIVMYRNPEPTTYGTIVELASALKKMGIMARMCTKVCFDFRRGVSYCGGDRS